MADRLRVKVIWEVLRVDNEVWACRDNRALVNWNIVLVGTDLRRVLRWLRLIDIVIGVLNIRSSLVNVLR